LAKKGVSYTPENTVFTNVFKKRLLLVKNLGESKFSIKTTNLAARILKNDHESENYLKTSLGQPSVLPNVVINLWPLSTINLLQVGFFSAAKAVMTAVKCFFP